MTKKVARSAASAILTAHKKDNATSKRREEALTTTPLHHPGSGLLPVHTWSQGLVMDTTVPDFLILVDHLGKKYVVVFKDGTYDKIMSIWERGPQLQWTVLWSFLRRQTLTQRLKNISAKALILGRTELKKTLAATGRK